MNEDSPRANRHLLNSYPTRSLREYLAYQSGRNTEQEEAGACRFEIEVEVGDGRSQVIVVDAETDIEREAELFCRKYRLDSQVQELLALTIREKYESEVEQSYNTTIAKEIESLTEVYANVHAREVLIHDSDPPTARTNPPPSDKGAAKILRNYHSRSKKYSLGENYLMENKENRPEINRISQEICEKLGKENIIEQRNRRSREKYENMVREKERREEEAMRECAFRPQINAISKQVDREMAEGGIAHLREEKKLQRFKRLYDDHWQIEQKKEQERQNYLMEIPFKPNINPISRKIMESKKSMNMLQSQEKPEKKVHLGCSHATNTSLPHTGRGPKNRNAEHLPIGDYLYSQAMKKSKPKAQEQRTEVKALSHSDYLISILKEKRINEIFTQLTPPPHQQLTCNDINLTLPPFKTGKFRLFTPIFNEMIELDVGLTRSEFLDAALQLFKLFSPEEKHSIIFRKEKEAPSDCSLYRSKSKSTMRRSNESGIYDRGLEHLRNIEEKNERNREDRARAELRQCTFKPQVHQ